METPAAFNPQEHSRRAKERALELMRQGDLQGAIDSMVSELEKDPTRPAEQNRMIAMMALDIKSNPGINATMVKEFIEGFAD